MKILFIVPYSTKGGSTRFRVMQYFPELQKQGFAFKLRPFYSNKFYITLHKKGGFLKKALYLSIFTIRRLFIIFTAPFYDIVFIHREAFPDRGYIFEMLFRIFSKRIIYDFDDSLFLKKPPKIKKIIVISDCVLAGNKFLYDYARQFNRNVHIFATSIDTDWFKLPAEQINNKKIVIGWMGSHFSGEYIPLLKNVFRAISKKYDNIEFRIIGREFNMEGLPLVSMPWSLEVELKELQGFDMGIMPMPDDDWARGKCAFKIIQYMAVGIPAVASRVGMNMEVIEDGKDGFLIENESEWIEKLSLLIEDRNLREKMGKNGRLKVENFYSIKANKQKFIGILEDTARRTS